MLQKRCTKTLTAFADSSENIASLHAGIRLRVHVGILDRPKAGLGFHHTDTQIFYF